MTELITLAVKLVAQAILVLWWLIQMTYWYTGRAIRNIRRRHALAVQILRAEQIGVTHYVGPAPGLDHQPAADWQQHEFAWQLAERTAVDLARATQAYARTR